MEKQKFVLLSLLLAIFALSHLSGQSWQIFRPDYTLNSNLVNLQRKIGTKQPIDVIVSKDGIVWLLNADAYPHYIKNIESKDYIIAIPKEDMFKAFGFKPSMNATFSMTPDSTIWMLTQENIAYLKDDDWLGYNIKTKAKSPACAIPVIEFDILGDLATDKQGNIWVSGIKIEGMKSGLAKLTDGQWEYFFVPTELTMDGDPSDNKKLKFLAGKEMVYETNPELKLLLMDISFDNKGNAYMLRGFYKDRGILLFNQTNFMVLSDENGNIPSKSVNDITSDMSGQIFISTDNGLFRLDGENKPHIVDPDLKFATIEFDNENLLWGSSAMVSASSTSWTVATQKSIEIVTRHDLVSKHNLVLTNENTPLDNGIKKIFVDARGKKYFIIDGLGLYILTDSPEKKIQNWTIYSPYLCDRRTMLKYRMTSGYNDDKWNFYGTTYISGDRNLVINKDGQWTYTDFSLTGEPNGLLSSPISIYGIVKGKSDDLYLGTSNSVYKFDKISNPVDGLDPDNLAKTVNAVTSDKNGSVWFGTNKGLAKFDGETFTYYNKNNFGLPDNWILNLLADKNDRIWIGTPNGLLCLDKENKILYNKKNGLDRERVMGIVCDRKGRVWFGITNAMLAAKGLSYEEAGQLKEELFPQPQLIKRMIIDKYDNIWIGDDNTLLCRKANGEYITFDHKNSPIKSNYSIENMFPVGSELWVVVNPRNPDSMESTSQLPGQAATKEMQIYNSLKSKLTGLIPFAMVLVFDMNNF